MFDHGQERIGLSASGLDAFLSILPPSWWRREHFTELINHIPFKMVWNMRNLELWRLLKLKYAVIASFIISIVSTTPSFIIRKMFEYSKPQQSHVIKQPSVKLTLEAEFEGANSNITGNVENNDEQAHIQTVLEMRREFYEWMFPWPSHCRTIAWIILIIWASVVCIMYSIVCVSVHGLTVGLKMSLTNE